MVRSAAKLSSESASLCVKEIQDSMDRGENGKRSDLRIAFTLPLPGVQKNIIKIIMDVTQTCVY